MRIAPPSFFLSLLALGVMHGTVRRYRDLRRRQGRTPAQSRVLRAEGQKLLGLVGLWASIGGLAVLAITDGRAWHRNVAIAVGIASALMIVRAAWVSAAVRIGLNGADESQADRDQNKPL